VGGNQPTKTVGVKESIELWNKFRLILELFFFKACFSVGFISSTYFLNGFCNTEICFSGEIWLEEVSVIPLYSQKNITMFMLTDFIYLVEIY